MPSVIESFKKELVKEARISAALPYALGAVGVGTGVTGAVLAEKGRRQQRKYMKATTGAIRSLAGEAMRARGQRVTIGQALSINTKADMISRRALAKAVRNNFIADASRGRAILKMHGVKLQRPK